MYQYVVVWSHTLFSDWKLFQLFQLSEKNAPCVFCRYFWNKTEFFCTETTSLCVVVCWGSKGFESFICLNFLDFSFFWESGPLNWLYESERLSDCLQDWTNSWWFQLLIIIFNVVIPLQTTSRTFYTELPYLRHLTLRTKPPRKKPAVSVSRSQTKHR